MPDLEDDPPGRGGRLPTGLFWAGVGLAPLAGLILLVGGGNGSLRTAAFLAVLAIFLIGLSIALRPGAEAVRVAMEETLLDEIDMLREDVRDDISTAARATHQAFDARMQVLQQTVDRLRAELDALRAGPAAPPPRMPAQPHQPAVAAATVPPPAPSPGRDGGAIYGGGDDRHRPGASGRAHVPTGVVRHTETVHHVTTRSTVVNPHRAEEDGSGAGYAGGYHREAPRDWSGPPPRRPAPEEESWTDRMLRERYGNPRGHDRPDADEPPADWRLTDRGTDRGTDRPRSPEPPDADGGRWAALHAEDRAAELRLGERRAAMRATEAGTEVRIEDRWAAMRREWDLDAPGPGRRDSGSGRRDSGSGRRDGGAPGRREVRALPEAGELPPWNADWEEPVRQVPGRRRAADEGEFDHAPDPRRIDYEISDERWR
jgi:hypothetical protein